MKIKEYAIERIKDIQEFLKGDGIEESIKRNNYSVIEILEYIEDMCMAEVRETSTFTTIKNIDNFKAEALDLITATVNLLLLSGLTEQDFEKHIEKLESYKNGKYKR